jgi:hypothetical protein
VNTGSNHTRLQSTQAIEARPTKEGTTKRSHILAIFAVASLLGVACGASGGPPANGNFVGEGDRAPDFTLPSAQGPKVSSQDYVGRRAVLLYFSMGPG